MKVLLTGSTGYIGRRLKQSLLASGEKIDLRLLVTDKRQVGGETASRVEIVEGNTFNSAALKEALRGIDTAYYLIHSMRAKKGDFEDLDRTSAQNFIEECVRAGVRRVIYLGGLGEKNSSSKHLRSRYETGEILSSRPDKIETIWFRAAVIIGAGGASYEIIKNLVQRLPVMPAPAWVRTSTQPIAIDDVITYLTRALTTDFNGNTIIDIGGEKLSFHDMLKKTSEFYSLKRIILPFPFFTPKMSSYLLILFTPVPFKLASALVAGLKVESVISNNNASIFFPDIKPVSYNDALKLAASEEIDEVVSHWSDGSSAWFHTEKKIKQLECATHTSSYQKSIEGCSREKVWKSVVSIGGDNGWFSMDFLWNLRGVFDKLTGGPGINRGRRFSENLRIGDSLDFWTVVDIIDERRLLLAAQMKLPGRAWLEFLLSDTELVITAFFIPKGIYGRLYWYFFLPFHSLIFREMLRKITGEAR